MDAVATMLQHAKSQDRFVRCAAIEGLGFLVERGDSETLAAVAAYVGDRKEVRRASAAVLEKLAEPGGTGIVVALREHLSHEDLLVKCTALKLLGRLADPSDGETKACIEQCLSPDEEEDVQVWAARTLKELEERGAKQPL